MTAISLDINTSGACRWCSTSTSIVAHGGPCPYVESIEFHPDGSVKRVQFKPVVSTTIFPSQETTTNRSAV